MKYITHSMASTTCVALNRILNFGLPRIFWIIGFAAPAWAAG
jgi:hypothetical protein